MACDDFKFETTLAHRHYYLENPSPKKHHLFTVARNHYIHILSQSRPKFNIRIRDNVLSSRSGICLFFLLQYVYKDPIKH